MKELVRTENLSKRYGDVLTVKSMNLSVMEGSIYGFCGPNGAGKSTTLKMLLGLTKPTEGRICLFGREMTAKNRMEILRQTGSLIESPSYYGHLSGRENMEILQGLLGVPKENVDEVLKIVRLHNQGKKKVSAYSLGMKQRLGLAAALLHFPKLLILDEPTNGLDPAGIQEMRELIRSLPEKYGMTVIISSHLLSEIDQIVDDIGIIANGKLKYQGSLSRLHEQDETKTLEEIFLEMTMEEVSL
ncbi:ABC transporter ATP-binding protein [bacterium 1XD8-76]|nr:ABC transporter ATP-binding protein [bacterium 1XD8-76]